jgi:hypothetical protein
LFCFSSYWLLFKYNNIKIAENYLVRTEITGTEKIIEQLSGQMSIDRQAISQQLDNNKQLMQASQNEWLLLKQTLNSFIIMLFIIVFFHLFFIWTLFRSQ